MGTPRNLACSEIVHIAPKPAAESNSKSHPRRSPKGRRSAPSLSLSPPRPPQAPTSFCLSCCAPSFLGQAAAASTPSTSPGRSSSSKMDFGSGAMGAGSSSRRGDESASSPGSGPASSSRARALSFSASASSESRGGADASERDRDLAWVLRTTGHLIARALDSPRVIIRRLSSAASPSHQSRTARAGLNFSNPAAESDVFEYVAEGKGLVPIAEAPLPALLQRRLRSLLDCREAGAVRAAGTLGELLGPGEGSTGEEYSEALRFCEAHRIASAAEVVCAAGGRPVGLLTVYSDGPRALQAEDRALLAQVAEYVGASLSNGTLVGADRCLVQQICPQQARAGNPLLGAEQRPCPPTPNPCCPLGEAAAEWAAAASSSASSAGEGGSGSRAGAGAAAPPEFHQRRVARLLESGGELLEVPEAGEALPGEDPADPALPAARAYYASLGARSLLLVPTRGSDGPNGLITVASGQGGREWTAEDQDLVLSVAQDLVLSVAQIRSNLETPGILETSARLLREALRADRCLLLQRRGGPGAPYETLTESVGEGEAGGVGRLEGHALPAGLRARLDRVLSSASASASSAASTAVGGRDDRDAHVCWPEPAGADGSGPSEEEEEEAAAFERAVGVASSVAVPAGAPPSPRPSPSSPETPRVSGEAAGAGPACVLLCWRRRFVPSEAQLALLRSVADQARLHLHSC
eukprot:tig00000042_g15433.t1